MTLDEAIAKAKADGDVQLVEWLRQARGADAAARWYTEKLRDANRTIRKLLDENDKLRELAVSYDSALHRMCDQAQRYVDCHDCILGKDYDNEDTCAIDELREAAYVVKVELE